DPLSPMSSAGLTQAGRASTAGVARDLDAGERGCREDDNRLIDPAAQRQVHPRLRTPCRDHHSVEATPGWFKAR
ncbi:MAG TPA: hypothetical protein PLM09_01725, partial [Casimicrobiaceae bacterium]|nr:hypothetical protein [Casimicrobiaceae bacterium]